MKQFFIKLKQNVPSLEGKVKASNASILAAATSYIAVSSNNMYPSITLNLLIVSLIEFFSFYCFLLPLKKLLRFVNNYYSTRNKL